MDDINKRVGFNIRTARAEKNLSQEKLAAKADLHRAYLGQIERGEKNIGLVKLKVREYKMYCNWFAWVVYCCYVKLAESQTSLIFRD